MTAKKNFKRLVRRRARLTGESYSVARRRLLTREGGVVADDNQSDQLADVVIVGITETEHNGQELAAIELSDPGTGRTMRILIGRHEALSIRLALEAVSVARPMTHDMLTQTIDAFGARLTRVDISLDPKGSTFYAEAVLSLEDGTERLLDCRPSDALAVAVRTDPRPTIRVPRELLGAGGGGTSL